MKLTQFLRGMFFGEWPASLRNRVNGLARVKRYGEEYGADAIEGHIVRTLRCEGGFWDVDPQPVYICTRDAVRLDGVIQLKGDRCEIFALADCVLEPIGFPGEGEQDQTLAWKRVPGPELIPLPVREMTDGGKA